MDIIQLDSITHVDAVVWNSLTGTGYPFLRHEFLSALEASGSVCAQTGWQPKHLLIADQGKIIAVMPLYLKYHSRGEYVFDQQWSDVYRQTGKSYYPKWLTAIPFTPCQGPRLACADGISPSSVLTEIKDYLTEIAFSQGISSWHCLFPEPALTDAFKVLDMPLRHGVQFHWFNRGYSEFADFLQTLASAKRKMIKKERRKAVEQGIDFIQIPGTAVTESQWHRFYKFYTVTYLKNGMQPYLTQAFFMRCAASMGESMLLVLAIKAGHYVGAALSFIGTDALYGRYWGCLEEFDVLHFEACYYQGLDYCIAHRLQRFDSGAQGEHKISRGFEPVLTHSAHWLQDAYLARAIQDYLARERKAVAVYKEKAADYLPYKKTK
jgi:predicted N-acyltransferase